MSLAYRLASVRKRTLTDAGRTHLVRMVADNVLAWYDKATPSERDAGRRWYSIARDYAIGIARRHRLTVDQAAALIATTSPQCPWERNLLIADRVASGGRPDLLTQSDKCDAILKDADTPEHYVSGPKVESFYHNIIGDETAVTVDTWAIRAACDNPALPMATRDAIGNTRTRYDIVADGYRLAAARRNVTPAVMQATVWVTIRDNSPEHGTDLPDPY